MKSLLTPVKRKSQLPSSSSIPSYAHPLFFCTSLIFPSPTYEQAQVGEDLLAPTLMPADCSVLRTPTIPGIILSDYIIISSVFSVNLFSDILSKDSQVRYCSPRHSQILFYKKCRKAAAGKQEVLRSCIPEKWRKVCYLSQKSVAIAISMML